MGHRIGYIRVSSGDQQPARQLDQVAVDRVFTDYASGKDVDRPQLAHLLAFVRPGDTVVVHSLDRLARNLADLRQLVARLTAQGVRVEFVHEQLTFTGDDSPMAHLMLSVMGAFAEFERAPLRERQREGIALAKQRGVYRGRKRASSHRLVRSPVEVPWIKLHGNRTCVRSRQPGIKVVVGGLSRRSKISLDRRRRGEGAGPASPGSGGIRMQSGRVAGLTNPRPLARGHVGPIMIRNGTLPEFGGCCCRFRRGLANPT